MKRDPADVVVDIILILAQAGLVLFVLTSLFLFQGCSMSVDNAFAKNKTPNATQFSFEPNRTTARYGIPVDDDASELDLNALESVYEQTVQCLNGVGETVDAISMAPDLGVMVPNWFVSLCTGEEVYDCRISSAACEAKGFKTTGLCPCRCRAGVQDNRIIVTTPNMQLVSGRLVTLITGVEDPWVDQRLVPCASIKNPSLK
jgi:hypothetical protein